jgi:hypothetical protein
MSEHTCEARGAPQVNLEPGMVMLQNRYGHTARVNRVEGNVVFVHWHDDDGPTGIQLSFSIDTWASDERATREQLSAAFERELMRRKGQVRRIESGDGLMGGDRNGPYKYDNGELVMIGDRVRWQLTPYYPGKVVGFSPGRAHGQVLRVFFDGDEMGAEHCSPDDVQLVKHPSQGGIPPGGTDGQILQNVGGVWEWVDLPPRVSYQPPICVGEQPGDIVFGDEKPGPYDITLDFPAYVEPAEAMGVPTCAQCGKPVPADGKCGVCGKYTLEQFDASIQEHLVPLLPGRLNVVTDAVPRTHPQGVDIFSCWVLDEHGKELHRFWTPNDIAFDECACAEEARTIAERLMQREARGR